MVCGGNNCLKLHPGKASAAILLLLLMYPRLAIVRTILAIGNHWLWYPKAIEDICLIYNCFLGFLFGFSTCSERERHTNLFFCFSTSLTTPLQVWKNCLEKKCRQPFLWGVFNLHPFQLPHKLIIIIIINEWCIYTIVNRASSRRKQ